MALLLVLTFTHGLIYATVTPPWQAPDETGHFEYAWLIARLGRLPTQDDLSPTLEEQLVASLYEWRFGEFTARALPAIMPSRLQDLPPSVFARQSRPVLDHNFSLAYLWQALFLLPVRGQDLTLQLLAARLSTVLLNVGIVWLAFLTFSELAPRSRILSVSMTLVVVFAPQHTFINSMVGDGPLAELMSCLVLYCWVRLFVRGARVPEVLGIVIGTVAGIWSKATALILLPVDIVLALVWLWRTFRDRWGWRQRAGLIAGCVGLGIGLWALSWSAPGQRLYAALARPLAGQPPQWVDVRGITFGQALLLSHDSFWANFGWMAAPVTARWYGVLLLFAALAVVGWIFGSRERRDFPPGSVALMSLAFFITLLTFVGTALLFPRLGAFQFQGRYLFPAMIPAAFLLVGGWSRLLPAGRLPALFASVAFFVLFDAWCLWMTIVPFFYYR